MNIKTIIGLSLLLSFALGAWKKHYKINKNKVLYALNCGSEKPYTSKDGFIYEADKYFNEGVVASYYNHPKVPRTGFKYTRDHELHRTERYNPNGFLEYDLPVKDDGDYVLILQFSEVNFERPGQRVTNIILGDTIVRPNHDTLKGGRISLVNIYIPFQLKDGQIFYASRLECENAFDSIGGTLRLRFQPIADNPKIDGIILFKGTIEETNFYYQDEIREYFDKAGRSKEKKEQLRDQMMEEYMLKKRMKRKVRNDHQEYDEFEAIVHPVPKKRMSKKLFLLVILVLISVFCAFNRRKGGKNPIYLVGKSRKIVFSDDSGSESDEDDQETTKKVKKTKKGKNKRRGN